MNLRDYVDGLECRRVYPGDEDILNNLQDFKCGDPKDFRTVVSESMLDRLKQYIKGEAEEKGLHDIYYVIMDKSVVLFFFSLQTGIVYTPGQIAPSDIGKLCCFAAESMGSEEYNKGNLDVEIFKTYLQSFDCTKYVGDSDKMAAVCEKIVDIMNDSEFGDQNTIFVEATYPCVELVNFCKNLEANEIWEDNNFLPAVGATLFWLKILPIIEMVSDKVGCKYVSLFAADKSEPGDNEKLVSYYGNALKFERPEKLNTIKPKYDWKCVFLCQEIKVLSDYKKQFIRDYLDVDSDEV